MKRTIITLLAALATWHLPAQTPDFERPGRDTSRMPAPRLFDTLASIQGWHPDFATMSPPQAKPVVPHSSVLVIEHKELPRRVVILNERILQIGQHLTISNGQAWNWGPYPDAYLDARTLSFPAPR